VPAEEVDTDRTSVKTYVPGYQKEEWKRQATELDMSLSEFVRTMVQAGRRGFPGSDVDETGETANASGPGERTGEKARPELEPAVVELLSENDYRSWDELASELTADVEQRLETTLKQLEDEGRVRHSPRNGGYILDA
jgi:hypothetical protein